MFNIQQFHVLPTQCIYVFCVDLRTNSIISLYSINWLVFIRETVCLLRGTSRIWNEDFITTNLTWSALKNSGRVKNGQQFTNKSELKCKLYIQIYTPAFTKFIT